MKLSQKQIDALKLGRLPGMEMTSAKLRAKKAGALARKAAMTSEDYKNMRALARSDSPKQIEHIRALGQKNVESGFLESIKTPEGSYRGGIAATHLRWHVARNKMNPDKCSLCMELELEERKARAAEPQKEN